MALAVEKDAPDAGRPVVLCGGPFSVEIPGVPKVGRVVVEDKRCTFVVQGVS